MMGKRRKNGIEYITRMSNQRVFYVFLKTVTVIVAIFIRC